MSTINGQNAKLEDITPASLDASEDVAEFLAADDYDAIKELLDVEGGSGDMLSTNNLSELTNTTTARTNLGLGAVATKNVGTGSTNVAAGDDSRFVTNGNSHDHNGGDGGTIAYASISGKPSTIPTKVKVEYRFFPAGQDSSLTRYPGNISTDSGGTNLDVGGSYKTACAQFSNSVTKRIGGNLVVPEDWDGGTVTASVRFAVGSNGVNGTNVRWELSTAFVDNQASFNPSMNSANVVTQTVAIATTSLMTVASWSGVTMTGAAAGRMMLFQLERIGGTDTMPANVDLFSLNFVFNVNLTT